MLIDNVGAEPACAPPELVSVCVDAPPFALPLVAMLLPELVCVPPVAAPPVAAPLVAAPPAAPAPPVAVEVTAPLIVADGFEVVLFWLEFVLLLVLFDVAEPLLLS